MIAFGPRAYFVLDGGEIFELLYDEAENNKFNAI